MQADPQRDADGSPYRELAPPPELSSHVVCVWLRTLRDDSRPRPFRVLPDGCVDIIHVTDRGRGRDPDSRSGLFVAGPDTAAQTVAPAPGYEAVGVRFHVGAAAAGLGVPASELRDLRVGLGDLWPDGAAPLEDALDAQPSPAARLRLLVGALAPRLHGAAAPDPIVAAAVAGIRSGRAGGVAALASQLAISERQLRRRFDVAVGYGPKRLQRVLRLQRLRALAAASEARRDPLARLALDAGYADQAHMSVDCRELSGVAATELLRAA